MTCLSNINKKLRCGTSNIPADQPVDKKVAPKIVSQNLGTFAEIYRYRGRVNAMRLCLTTFAVHKAIFVFLSTSFDIAN
jgi:hypothetical protein